MEQLKQRILKDGVVKPGDILKVDAFLNHQIDMGLMAEIGREFARLFGGCGVSKVLTIESSGIAIACAAAQAIGVPALFAKKSKTRNLDGDLFSAPVHSFTHGVTYTIVVSKKFLLPSDRVLIVDDFLANGQALAGLIDITRQSGAALAGCGIAIEKVYMGGGDRLRVLGVRIESLARIASMDESGLTFCEE